MPQRKLQQLAELGQSIWIDYIRRAFIESGEMAQYVEMGVRGMTSNPSIFEKAIAGSTDYDRALHRLVDEGKSVGEIYEALAVEDIRRAADVLRPVYDESDGRDGFISLEVRPAAADDTDQTLEEARRLFRRVDRPNVMIKVPATEAGYPAIEALIGEGRNINITLMFSLDQYDRVTEAYLSGLERLAERGEDLSRVASVASFFVSRVDVKVDQMLEEIGTQEAKALEGTIGIANAKMAYQRFAEVFQGERWQRLADRGARVQKVLWASTSTKDPAYPDTLYVDNLIGPHTVNTVPLETLQAFLERGTVSRTVDEDLEEARAQLETLADLGIELSQVTDELLEEGVEKFARPFEDLMESIEQKRRRLQEGRDQLELELGDDRERVDAALETLAEERVLSRIWAHDHTVWKSDPEEITNRLGWLHSPNVMVENVGRMEKLAEAARSDGYTHALHLGMGGSSLAPDLFGQTFDRGDGGLDLQVLDSTDPATVLAHRDALDPARTLFIVATKSGTTVETLSLFRFFYAWVAESLGEDEAGEHFIAITDSGTRLTELAERYHFRAVFRNDPNIGGRYSALSFFGLLPACLAGVDVRRLLDRARRMASGSASCVEPEKNPAASLGVALGELAQAGRDKATFVLSPEIASFGDWVEQLLAESTGKSGTGIVPIVGEPLGEPSVYGDDRVFIHLRLDGDGHADAALDALHDAGHPLLRLHLHDRYDLGGQFFLWELATAVAGWALDIHPFNQPNVESAKDRAREMVSAYQEAGELPSEAPDLRGAGIAVYGDVEADHPAAALGAFLDKARPGDYVALQAFLPPSDETTEALRELRVTLRDQTRLATTLGYGPRFLHSTGQLHKGDGGHGLFIQFTADHEEDAEIPDEASASAGSITFGVLIHAQALGDRQALLDAGRRVIRFHLEGEVPVQIRRVRQGMPVEGA